METFLITLIDKGSYPACIIALAFIAYSAYKFKNQRYNGENPYKCPFCGKKCEKTHDMFYPETQTVHERWYCKSCKKHRHFIIH